MQAMWIALVLVSLATAEPPVYHGLPSINQLVEEAGYEVSHYTVTTEDGYMIWMHRLGMNSEGPPVLLQHGVLNAADLWINRGAEEDLAFLLLKNGYDVFLGNQRGNAFALNHSHLNRFESAFWNFSFHESGYYDLPAMMDKILEINGAKKLFYVGFSLGTTVFLTMMSTREEYNRKVEAGVLLAPVGYLPNSTELRSLALRTADLASGELYTSLGKLNLTEVLPRGSLTIAALQTACGANSPLLDHCLDLSGNLLGEHRTNIDRESFGYRLSFSPAGTSLKTLYHLAQVIKSQKFRQFDYEDNEMNEMAYGSEEPPSYRLSEISAPVALLWARSDPIISQTSVKRMAGELGNLIEELPIADPEFTHSDFIWGRNAPYVCYPHVLRIFNTFL